MVGPFIKFGPEVVEACLAAGCHYTDTTGEQDWLLHARAEVLAPTFANKGLLLSPGVAQMYTTGEIAAQHVPRNAGARHAGHRWCSGSGCPTYRLHPDHLRPSCNGQVATTWSRTSSSSGTLTRACTSWSVPGQHEAALALPWGGTAHPVWFKRRPARGQLQGARRRVQQGAEVMPRIVAAAHKVNEKSKTLPTDR